MVTDEGKGNYEMFFFFFPKEIMLAVTDGVMDLRLHGVSMRDHIPNQTLRYMSGVSGLVEAA